MDKRELLMLNALEDIALLSKKPKTLSTQAELHTIILKMESIASIALRKLEGRLPL